MDRFEELQVFVAVTQQVKNMTPKLRQLWEFALEELPSLPCFVAEKPNAAPDS